MCSALFFPVLLLSSCVVEERRQAARWRVIGRGGGGVGGAFSELQAREGLEGEGEKLQGVRRWCSATSTPGLKRGGGP